MKVLILQGSPRANGNTAWMAEEYKKAAEAAGHEVTLLNVSKKKIAGCLACEYCHKGGGREMITMILLICLITNQSIIRGCHCGIVQLSWRPLPH